MSQPLPPVYRDCRRLLVHTEAVVQRFSRYHKYTVGTDLRQQAMALMRGVHLAVYDRPNQPRHVQALVWLADDYKLTLQLAIEVGAFVHAKGGQQQPSPGFAAFETAAQLAAQIGKQCGGWQKASSGQVPPKPASTRQAQAAGMGQAPASAGSQSVAAPPAHPASLSEHTASRRIERSGAKP